MPSAKETRLAIQALLGFEGKDLDGVLGPVSLARFYELSKAKPGSAWPTNRGTRAGDGTWPFVVEVDGKDLVLRDVWVTCFGGSNDPQDSGATASGISTKDNPNLAACALPMDGKAFPKASAAVHAALDGSPIPRVPWNTKVRFTAGGKSIEVPVIDIGPAKKTGNAGDLTIAAARHFKPNASATNFKMRMDIRILGAA